MCCSMLQHASKPLPTGPKIGCRSMLRLALPLGACMGTYHGGPVHLESNLWFSIEI